MKLVQLTIETFQNVAEPENDANEWTPDWESQEPKFERVPLIVQGGIDLGDMQFYLGIRDDRVVVMFKNGSLLSVVSTLAEFEYALARAGVDLV